MRNIYLTVVLIAAAIFALKAQNVGIGTTSPSKKFEVKVTSDGDGIVVRRDDINAAGGVYFTYGTNTSMTGAIQGDRDLGGTNNGGVQVLAANNRPIQFFTKGNQSGTGIYDTEEIMRINGDGNVGIGTTGPNAKLEVAGNMRVHDDIRFTNGSGNNEGLVWGSGSWTSYYTRIFDDGNLHLLTDDAFFIKDINSSTGAASGTAVIYANMNDNRVGINDETPSYALDVNGDMRATSNIYANDQFVGRINVEDTRDDNFGPDTYDREAHFEFKRLSAIGLSASGTYSGMMTIAPWTDNSGDNHHQLNFNNSGIYYRSGQPNSTSWGSWDQVMTESGVNSLISGSDEWTRNSNQVYPNSTAYLVGIGTTSPDAKYKLQVNGNVYIDQRLSFGQNHSSNQPTPGGYTLGWQSSDWATFIPVYSGSRSDLRLYIEDDDDESFSIWGGSCAGGGCNDITNSSQLARFAYEYNYLKGNVGINTTSPTYTLHVNGRIKSNGINETSDARLKTNVNNIDGALSLVTEMRPVTYNWKMGDAFAEWDFEEGTQYGLIAQELEQIVPELVDTDKEGWKSIQYSHLVPVLIKALQEQQDMLEAKDSEIASLKASIEDYQCTQDDKNEELQQQIDKLYDLLQLEASK